MPVRLPAAAALAALALLSSTAHAAAPKPQLLDPKGDSVGGVGTVDIVSALWRTSGETVTTVVKGRKVVTPKPRKLIATLNLAAAPTAQPGLGYEVSANVAGCGNIRFTYWPGTVFGQVLGDGSFWNDCGDPGTTTTPGDTLIPGVQVTLGATSITWTLSFSQIPKPVKVGAKVTDFHAAVDVVEPVSGTISPGAFGVHLDEGSGTGSWILR
jgi:hypothetical protein